MKIWEHSRELEQKVHEGLSHSVWFKNLSAEQINTIIASAELLSAAAGETIVQAGEEADAFYLLLKGHVIVEAEDRERTVELGRIQPPFVFGEVGLLLNRKRSASIVAADEVLVMRLTREAFFKLFNEIEEFRLAVTRGLARRLASVSALNIPRLEGDAKADTKTSGLLPLPFMERNGVLPLSSEGRSLRIAFVDAPTPGILSSIRQMLPDMVFEPVQISREEFDRLMKEQRARLSTRGRATGVLVAPAPEKLMDLARRVVAEGGSDLHLLPMRSPHWRIDGDLLPMENEGPLEEEEAFELMRPMMQDRHIEELERDMDTDFACGLEGIGRFRVNVYRSALGVGAALRSIPSRVRTLEELGMPSVLKKLALLPNGLIVVSGATGSGKSTTLAAMLDAINHARPCHILTLEDPIEFVHDEDRAVIDQREIGTHAKSFPRGLRAALREDPDIILVGEMRDPETVTLALEAANTGHLVLSTLHTNSAVTTVERMVDMFPSEVRSQVRVTLGEVLRGVICQTLAKRRDGGRVAATEILVVTPAVGNLIREDKPQQLPNAMVSGAKFGCQALNDSLARLVKERKILKDEALRHTTDQEDLLRRLVRPQPTTPGNRR